MLKTGFSCDQKKFTQLLSWALSFAFGAIAVLGWAPIDLWPITLISFGVLYWLLQQDKTAVSTAGVGFSFGLGLHIAGHGWIYTALHTKTGLGVGSALLGAAIFFVYLSLCTAIPCMLLRILFNRLPYSSVWTKVIAFACLLTLGEWGRSLFFNGFTSLSLGYSLIDTWLAGVVPVTGLYGLSFLGFCIAGLAAASITENFSKKLGVLAITIVLLGSWGIKSVNWTYPIGSALTYRLIQANVAQTEKFDPFYAGHHAKHIVDLIEQRRADLIVTPETAFTSFLNELPADLMLRLRRFGQGTSSNVFLGIATESANSDGYNSILQIRPDANSDAIPTYNKVHLMPFGEYSPLGFKWFTGLLQIPLKDMSAGNVDQLPFEMQKGGTTSRLGSLICQEDLTSSSARYWAHSANILLNPSNLAWFEKSLAIPQRLQIVRMRALEVGRPILRVANTGITAAIDEHGKVLNQTEAEKEEVLAGEIRPVTGLTPYARFGDAIICIICIFLVGVCTVKTAIYRFKKSDSMLQF